MGLKLGDISPAAAMMGEDGFIRDAAGKGALGLVPAMMARKDRKKEKAVAAASEAKGTSTMKKGGKVRGSGCCKRTKKCKMY